jgi:dethiobiotin synthetase
MRSLFITGTDTGVGKTLVTALLALHFQEQGINCGVMKPFASGCEWVNGELQSEDALFLQAATEVQDEPGLINPIRLQEPLAPLVAARRAGIETPDFFGQAQTAFGILQERYEMMLIEGVGGLLAPIAERERRILTGLDLIEEWQMPVVIVARRTLGTINHTLLTVEALKKQATIIGLVFCDAQAVLTDDVAAQTSPQLIAEMTGLPIWGQVPFLQDLRPDALRLAANAHLQIPIAKGSRF